MESAESRTWGIKDWPVFVCHTTSNSELVLSLAACLSKSTKKVRVIWILACVNQETVKPTELVEASQNVIFAATETLGPHRFQVISIRQEYRSDQLELESTEVLDIEWHSWDSFSFSHNVDGESTLEVVVTSGSCWKRMYGGEWQRRPDAEPYACIKMELWTEYATVFMGLFVSQGEET